ncbi:hypothetical protein LEP1GSC151_5307 [Leptospira interrogans serovar Grippotyphosa str. LT2186]|uniref:Uncharacterized protein n=1 Tax=Leptospira interrogans serovar Grippotyphosa str. LT2186 TaxID=1001599 RepID=M3FQN2_LEPIR|nr:hypothetical protein LEP1GSC009_3703 [Leptospira interrogans serovar Grippotyphosa str. Andaman]EMG09759.1 hypothetical protein LEP1GSC151_5307 [Leptospira interrogans serovar Grippotyphosa str. LT2186]
MLLKKAYVLENINCMFKMCSVSAKLFVNMKSFQKCSALSSNMKTNP